MLAQSFKTPADLGLSDAQFDALRKTLVLLETGKLVHVPIEVGTLNPGKTYTGHFNMADWNQVTDCGTACCICGTAELVGNLQPRELMNHRNMALQSLFLPSCVIDEGGPNLMDITPAQAARALRSYLTTGEPNWEEALHV